MTDVIRSVLFVDFDNVFFSLQSADKAAAKSFADDPRRWLDAIESGALIESLPGAPFAGQRRRILMRRCYANPAVMRYFRSYFTRSGFQIVDCPPLTGRGKNSADIYMVVDMLDALKHETRFDEFIILSGDADFTPVLLRLRAYDRSSIIYSNAVTAAAYKSLCDGMITEERLIDLAGGDSEAEDGGTQAVAPALQGMPAMGAITPMSYAAGSQPATSLERRTGDDPRPGETLIERLPERGPDRAIERMDRPHDRGRPFDRRRQPVRMASEPLEPALVDSLGRPLKIAPELAALARRVNAATNVPMFASEVYAALFRAIARDVRENGFSFNRTVNAVIRRLGDAGLRLRPQHVAFVIKGLMLSGHEFLPSDTPATLAKGFRRQALYLCANEDLTLSESDRAAIGMWIVGGLRNLSESEITASEPVTTDASLAAEVAGVDPDDDQSPPTDEDAAVQLDDGDLAEFAAGDDGEEDGADLADAYDGEQPLDLGSEADPLDPIGPSASEELESDNSSGAGSQKPGPDLESLLARIRSPGRS